jgi:hypothetical protein
MSGGDSAAHNFLRNCLVPSKYRVQMLQPTCDPQSTCYRSAISLLVRLNKGNNWKAEALSLLDHKELLTLHCCNGLALLTVREAMRHAENPAKLEELESELLEKYKSTCSEEDVPYLRAVHLGRGVEALLIKKKSESDYYG